MLGRTGPDRGVKPIVPHAIRKIASVFPKHGQARPVGGKCFCRRAFYPMKTARAQLTIATMALVLTSAASPSLATAAQPKENVILDFTYTRKDPGPSGQLFRAYQYVWDTWDKHVADLPGRGALIKAPTNRGVMGENRTVADFAGLTSVDIYFVIGTANMAKQLAFDLVDSDGTEQTWTIPLTDKTPGHLVTQHLDLTNCDQAGKPGKKPGLNLKKIDTWQIKGDWSEPPVEVLLVKVTGTK
jgi:hypothetical protein